MKHIYEVLFPVLPEIWVMVMACIILLIGVFVKSPRKISYYLAQLALLGAALLTWYVGDQLNISSHIVITFENTFRLDPLAVVLKYFIYLSVFISFLYTPIYNQQRQIPANEYYVLALLSMLGMMVLVSADHLMTLFLGLELLSLPIYAIVALRRTDERAIEAAMKYFVTGAMASGLLLYGMSILFGATKTLALPQIAEIVQSTPVSQNMIMIFGLVFTLAGAAFKLGAAPFHMWVPDVYDGSPSTSTLFLSTGPKIAAFGLLARLLITGMPSLAVQWHELLMVIAILSIAVGNLAAIVQSNIKRMLAYSSIAHIGYMLLGFVAMSDRGYAAAFFYIISYSIMTLGAFGLVILMSRQGFEADQISDYSGLNTRNPWLAFMMLLVMFSLAGVPPIVGFIAKLGIFEALIEAHFIWLAVIAILFTIIGAYYYIRVVKVMYFESPKDPSPIVCTGEPLLAISITGIAVLLLGIFPGGLFSLSHFIF